MSADQSNAESEAEQIAAMFNEIGAGHLTERMGVVVTSATKEEIVGTMPVAGNTQVYGLLHGGASVVLAETLGSLMGALYAGPEKQVVGVDIDPDLVERGKYNIGRARGLKCRAHIVCCDAALFDLPPDTSIVYFRNPFSGKVLAAVLENVRKLQRDVHIICNLPIPSAFENEIRQSRWLAIQDEFLLSGDRKGLIFATI